MTNAYKEYLRERELERAGLGAFRAIQPQRSTVESDVLVPLLQSLAIALAVGLAGGAVVLFVGFNTTGWTRWALAGEVLGGAFIFAFLVCLVVFVLQHRRTVKDPIDMLWQRLDRAIDAMQPSAEDEPQYVITRGYTPKVLPATVDHEVGTIEPAVDRATKALYTFITRTWPTGKITRRYCGDLGFSRRTWEEYVAVLRFGAGKQAHYHDG